jgi:hypothetical protein
VYIPLAQQVSWDENPVGSQYFTDSLREAMSQSTFFQDWLQHLALDNQFRFIDLTPSLKQWKKNYLDASLYNSRDGHFSREGHQVVADILEPILRESFVGVENE